MPLTCCQLHQVSFQSCLVLLLFCGVLVREIGRVVRGPVQLGKIDAVDVGLDAVALHGAEIAPGENGEVRAEFLREMNLTRGAEAVGRRRGRLSLGPFLRRLRGGTEQAGEEGEAEGVGGAVGASGVGPGVERLRWIGQDGGDGGGGGVPGRLGGKTRVVGDLCDVG